MVKKIEVVGEFDGIWSGDRIESVVVGERVEGDSFFRDLELRMIPSVGVMCCACAHYGQGGRELMEIKDCPSCGSCAIVFESLL